MKKTSKEFQQWKNKTVTLLGMSNVGKTTLANILPDDEWFHYSSDYRIGTRYLAEPILDLIKNEAMQHKLLRDLLRRDLIYIGKNISVHNQTIVTNFLGMIGNPELGGLSVDEFKRRQRLYHQAEVCAMGDVNEFIHKAQDIYGYPNFLNDAGGSICGLSEECWRAISDKTMVLYFKADETMEQTLIQRAREHPKPLCYDEKFLDKHLPDFLKENNIKSADEIVPNEFAQWVFPKLLEYRRPLYENLAKRHGYTVDAKQIFELRDEKDFIELVCEAINNA